MSYPSFTAGQYLSAGMVNDLTADALQAFGRATAYRQGFYMPDNGYTSNISDDDEHLYWEGYMIHQKNTIRYDIRITGSNQRMRIYINSVEAAVTTSTVSTTTDISGLGLTVGGIYPVGVYVQRQGTTMTVSADMDLHYISETDTITYNSPTTFVSTDVPTATQLNDIRSDINDLVSAGSYIPATYQRNEFLEPFNGSGDPEQNVVRVGFRHIHDYALLRADNLAATGSGGGQLALYYDENEVFGTTSGDTNTTIDLTDAGGSFAGPYSYTVGNIYIARLAAKLTGTGGTEDVSVEALQISPYGYGATPPGTIPSLAHGTVVDETIFNWYGTLYDYIHPGASSPTIPLYYESPFGRKARNKEVQLRRRDRYLKYVYAGPGTPQISWGGGFKAGMPAGSNDGDVLVFDLDEIANLTVGQRYTIDDVHFAVEDSSASPYTP